MKRIAASVVKARRLAIMKDVQATGEPVVITKRGSPVAEVVPATPEIGDIFGFIAGEFKIVGNIESPVVPLKRMR